MAAPGGDGLSLREAIALANASAGTDTITFAGGPGGAFEGGETITLTMGELMIDDAISINGDLDGDHTADVTIDADQLSRVIFASAELTLTGIVVTGGLTDGDTLPGGGILATARLEVVDSIVRGNATLGDNSQAGGIGGTGDVVLTNTLVTDNRTEGVGSGGGGVFAGATLTVVDSTISNNGTSGDSAFGGGAVSADNATFTNSIVSGNRTLGQDAYGGGIVSAGTVLVDESTVSGNSTTGYNASGGGIFATGVVTITQSTVLGNTTYGFKSSGGGINSVGGVNVTQSTISDNGTFNFNAAGGGIASPGTVTVEASTIRGNVTHGTGSHGGGIVADAVSITSSTITGNATEGAGSGGGGIAGYLPSDFVAGGVSGSITITNSTVSGNSAAGPGGGLFAIDDVTITNTTVSGNATSGDSAIGGGIASFDTASIVNSAVTGNSTSGDAATGGGVATLGAGLTLTNSIVTGNVTSHDGVAAEDVGGTVSAATSLIGADPAAIFAQTYEVVDSLGVQTGVFAGLLAENGGPVKTVALLADAANPALDASGAGATGADARGYAAYDFAGVPDSNGSPRDLGAFELQYAEERSLTVTTLEDVVDAFDGLTSLREALAFANDPNANAGTGDADTDGNANDAITFAVTLAGGTIVLTQGQLEVTADVTIDGAAAPGIAITTGGASRILHVSADTALRGLTLAGGHAQASGGGAVFAEALANLTIENSAIFGNTAQGAGGAIYSAQGDLTLINTTIADNATSGESAGGGGIFGDGGTITLINTTVSGNSTSGQNARGGGVSGVSAAIELTNSIVLGNASGFAGTSGDDVYSALAVVSSTGGLSIVGGDPGAPTAADVFAATHEVMDANSGATGILAGVIADNGGPVKTIALRADAANPALDAGDDTLAPAADARGEQRFDQTGVAPNPGNRSDLGAFELQDQINLPPALAPVRAVETQEDVTTGPIAIGASDPNGDPLSFSIPQDGAPDHGAVLLNDGSFTYTPDPDYNGDDQFVIRVADGRGGVASQTVSVTIHPVNDPPSVAAQNSLATLEDTPTDAVYIPGSDPEGDMLTFRVGQSPSHGSVAFEGNHYVYTPDHDYFGADAFTVLVGDGNGGTTEQTVSVSVLPANDAPVAAEDVYSIAAGQLAVIGAASLLSNDSDIDGDSLSVVSVSDARHGTVSLSDGAVTFTPEPGFGGVASFTYTVSDGQGGTDAALVSLIVSGDGQPVNRPPVIDAPERDPVALADTPLAFAVDAYDPDGDAIGLSVAGAGHGTVAIGDDGLALYTPDAGFTGDDAFVVTATDSHGGSASLRIDLAVIAPDISDTYSLVASDTFTGSIGGSGSVFGTAGFQSITVIETPGTVMFDPSFSRGDDLVTLPGDASDWYAVRQGSSVLLGDGDTFVTLPVGPQGTAIAFDDGARVLQLSDNAILLGTFEVSDVFARVDTPAQTMDLPGGDGEAGRADLVLDQGASVQAGGDYDIFGTEGREDVTVLSGQATFDPSFNRGGDVLHLPFGADIFMAVQDGTGIRLTGGPLDMLLPAGPAGMTIDFAGDERVLLIAHEAIVLGSQTIDLSGTTLIA